MDSAFWDQSISSPQTLEGSAKSVPGEPFPLDGARASRALRIQQLSFLKNGFPLCIIPSLSPPSQKELGSFSLQSLLFRPSTSNWWLGIIGQFRPKKRISAIRTELQSADELELSLPDHDITLDAAWPELFMDHKGKYWEVPESISLDVSSLPSDSGLLYRFGIHKSSGHPQAFNALDGEVPSALLPGLCAKAAFSYEKSKDIWRRKETKEDFIVKTDKGSFWRPSYDVRLKETHAAISGIIDARLDIFSLSSSAKRVFKSSSSADNSLSSPRFNLIFQQQVAGPIFFRVDSKFLLDSKSGKRGPYIEDLIYSLSYSLRLLRSGKVVAWYSPKRKEGMIELRLLEF
ncbi:hypothetical protein CRYUN_Cryun01aG0254900 [Craigia yunnanensis]